MNGEISIIDRGRGPQLSTNRITVQDLVPYFQRHCSHAEIRQIMPVLTDGEIDVVKDYYLRHHEQLQEEDRQIRQRTDERVRLQRLRFPEPEGTKEERLARMKELLKARREGTNGDRHTG